MNIYHFFYCLGKLSTVNQLRFATQMVKAAIDKNRKTSRTLTYNKGIDLLLEQLQVLTRNKDRWNENAIAGIVEHTRELRSLTANILEENSTVQSQWAFYALLDLGEFASAVKGSPRGSSLCRSIEHALKSDNLSMESTWWPLMKKELQDSGIYAI